MYSGGKYNYLQKLVLKLISDLQVVSEVANKVGFRTEPTIELLGHVPTLLRAHQLLLLQLIVVHFQDILNLIVNRIE